MDPLRGSLHIVPLSKDLFPIPTTSFIARAYLDHGGDDVVQKAKGRPRELLVPQRRLLHDLPEAVLGVLDGLFEARHGGGRGGGEWPRGQMEGGRSVAPALSLLFAPIGILGFVRLRSL